MNRSGRWITSLAMGVVIAGGVLLVVAMFGLTEHADTQYGECGSILAHDQDGTASNRRACEAAYADRWVLVIVSGTVGLLFIGGGVAAHRRAR